MDKSDLFLSNSDPALSILSFCLFVYHFDFNYQTFVSQDEVCEHYEYL